MSGSALENTVDFRKPQNRPEGRFWGFLFFVFMSAAALTTVIAVLENIIAFFMDGYGWSRRKAVTINFVVLTLLTLPCILGFNVWSDFQPFGPGRAALDLEDFIISNNILPLGSVVYVLFCCLRKKGWGWENFLEEANTGRGLKCSVRLHLDCQYSLPSIIVAVSLQGYISEFFGK